ncbi:MAG TPA: hypothetical protein VG474_13375 [Solirubrobacteraceae bacterium]|nr:hypothetical protein [Solirubrobacteraceae bacterium]
MTTEVSIQRAVPSDERLPPDERLPAAVLALAGLAGTAGLIHLVAALQHVDENWMLPVFFALVGAAQVAAGWRIHRVPGEPGLLVAVALGAVALALLWVFSRTTGVPFGPDAGEVSSVGVADTIVTLLELAFAALAAALVTQPARGEQRLAWLDSPMGVRLTFAVLSMALLLAALGGHEH